MTDQNKIRGKAIQKKIRAKRIKDLLSDMPISTEEFIQLINFITSSECDTTLRRTKIFLQNHKKSDAIISWLQEHGGHCDCEVIMNVVNDYLQDLELIPHEEAPAETTIEAMFSMKFNKKHGLNPSKNPLDTKYIHLEKIPSPWKLLLQPNPAMKDKAHLCYGNKGMSSECRLSYFECRPVITPEVLDLTKLWKSITGLSPAYPISLEKDKIDLKNGELIGTLISNQGYVSIFGCYTTKSNPDWHFVFTSTIARKRGDLAEIRKLLKEAYLK